MNWKTTSSLLILAGALFAFIYLVEQHTRSTSTSGQAPQPLLPIQAKAVTGVLLRGTNNVFVVRAARANGQWQLTQPSSYPAQGVAIDQLLEALAQITDRNVIPLSELAQRNQTLADFGLQSPLASLTLEVSPGRYEVLFGRKTPLGDNVYVQVPGRPGIFIVPAELFDRLPHSPTAWRSPTLVEATSMNINRLELRLPGAGFEIFMETNQTFYLTKPTLARADVPKVRQLFMAISAARVAKFVTDDPRAELEQFGLNPPQAELVLGWGTNDLLTIQFGKSPTNAPDLVFARRSAQTNIVLLPKTVLDALRVPPNELRDRRVLSFDPAQIASIDVRGSENFSVRHQSNDVWLVSGNPTFVGDPELIRRWVRLLTSMEGTVEKDVVTDFAQYGLADPLRQYQLKAVVTDPATGNLAIRVLDQLDIGAREPERVFVRRATETTVYSVSRLEYDQMPGEAWQLRDRHIWTFSTNDVRSVTVTRQRNTRRFVRTSTGSWTLAPGSTGVFKNPAALPELLEQLGQLQAEVWVDRGAERKTLYGFRDDGFRLEIELANGGASRNLVLEFGGVAPSQFPYAMATVDGQSWIFEFPLTVFVELVRDLPVN